MKTAILVVEALAGEAYALFGGRTAMETARTSRLSEAIMQGAAGWFNGPRGSSGYCPEQIIAPLIGWKIEEENMTVPVRGPMEALALGVPMHQGDWVYRVDFLTVDGNELKDRSVSMSEEELRLLAETFTKLCAEHGARFHVAALVPRMYAIFSHAEKDGLPEGESPVILSASRWTKSLPHERRAHRLRRVVDICRYALMDISINHVRLDLGENPADVAWLWGGGRAVVASSPPPTGGTVVVSNSAMVRGVALSASMQALSFQAPDTTQEVRSFFDIPGVAHALSVRDEIVVYVGVPNITTGYGNNRQKVHAIEAIDRYVATPFLKMLEAHRPYRLLVTTDCRHVGSGVGYSYQQLPFFMMGSGIEPDLVIHWDEHACRAGSYGEQTAWSVRELLLGTNRSRTS